MTSWIHTGFAQRVHFGAGAMDTLPAILRDLGARRVLLASTEGRLASPDGERLVSRLDRVLVSTFAGVRSHVPAPSVQAAVLQARRDGVDAIVSFGGGSCMDLAKAVAYFVEQEAGTPGASYTDRAALMHVAVPTTYSGAEVTPWFGITDERTRAKTGGGGPTTAPVAVVYDPVITLSTPANVSAETAMNALAHCVESSLRHSAVSRSGGHCHGRRRPHRALAPGRGRRARRHRGPYRPARRSVAGGTGPRERVHGRPPRAGSTPRGTCRHLPRPGQRASCCRTRCASTPTSCPSSSPASAPCWAIRPIRPAPSPDSRRAPGCPRGCRCSGCRRAISTPWPGCRSRSVAVRSNPKPVGEEDARAILAAAY